MPLEELAAGRRIVGLNQVRRALLREGVQKIFLADDADPQIRSEVLRLALDRGIPLERGFSRASLGRACAISRGAVVAALQRETLLT